jgi:hypothetical protein
LAVVLMQHTPGWQQLHTEDSSPALIRSEVCARDSIKYAMHTRNLERASKACAWGCCCPFAGEAALANELLPSTKGHAMGWWVAQSALAIHIYLANSTACWCLLTDLRQMYQHAEASMQLLTVQLGFVWQVHKSCAGAGVQLTPLKCLSSSFPAFLSHERRATVKCMAAGR